MIELADEGVGKPQAIRDQYIVNVSKTLKQAAQEIIAAMTDLCTCINGGVTPPDVVQCDITLPDPCPGYVFATQSIVSTGSDPIVAGLTVGCTYQITINNTGGGVLVMTIKDSNNANLTSSFTALFGIPQIQSIVATTADLIILNVLGAGNYDIDIQCISCPPQTVTTNALLVQLSDCTTINAPTLVQEDTYLKATFRERATNIDNTYSVGKLVTSVYTCPEGVYTITYTYSGSDLTNISINFV